MTHQQIADEAYNLASLVQRLPVNAFGEKVMVESVALRLQRFLATVARDVRGNERRAA